ncbi:MAG: M20/M25/M40 family metallo-hydrolase [Pedobacter sp.]|nr:MAG: M20/M25/M40 family metallo-hydrolase [Pedobacter sp.]
MFKKNLTFLFFFLLGSSLYAQDINKIISREYVDHLIKTLSADDMQGRKAFTPGIEKAATFIESEFQKIGLQPLEGEKGFRQTFFKYQIKPSQVEVKIDGQAISSSKVFVLGVNSGTLTFNQSNSEKVVVFDTNKPFREQYMAVARGAKRQLVLLNEAFEKDFNELKKNPVRASIGDTDKPEKANAIVFVLGENSADNFEVNLTNSVEKLELFNVGGIIPGKSKAKEYVIFSGHFDHMGIVKPKEGDSIMNGADDNASGTTAMIALAKYYKALKNNERTLIFVAFTAEEIGGYGARYFSQKYNPDDVVAMFNIEMIGKESKFGKNAAFITGYDKSDFGAILQKNLKGTEFTFHPDPYTSQNLFYRSDNATLAALGVPAHTISTDQIDTDKHYHQVTDEYKTLDVDNILSTIKAIAKSAVSIVKGQDTPSRIPKLNSNR